MTSRCFRRRGTVRRKINDAQGKLPLGAGRSIVTDDYGDVGVFFVIYGKDSLTLNSRRSLTCCGRELLLVEDVAKIGHLRPNSARRSTSSAGRTLDRARHSERGDLRSIETAESCLGKRSRQVGEEFITLSPIGEFISLEDF